MYSNLKCIFLYFLASSFLLLSCHKEDKNLDSSDTSQTQKAPTFPNSINRISSVAKSGTPVQTVIGQELVNPYTVENMTAAWNQIYPEHQVSQLPVTDIYMKFAPQSIEQLTALQDAIDAYDVFANHDLASDPTLTNYPLAHEIITMGDYYHDSKVPPGEVTYQYAVVKPGFQVPAGIPYEVVAELVNAPYSSYLTAEAFRRAGVTYIDNYGEEVVFCDPSCPAYPACLAHNQDCEGSNDDGIYELPLPCLPGYNTWPYCMPVLSPASPLGPIPAPGGGTTCNCPGSGNPLKPEGCILVEDTQLGMEGVDKIRVHVTDIFSLFHTAAETSTNGCWKINRSFNLGARPTVIWRNDRVLMKGIFGVNFIQFGIPLQHSIGYNGSPPYNNYEIQYTRPTNNDNNDRNTMYWYASTGNNAIFEFDYYAAQEGFQTAPSQLKVLVANMGSAASAPMFSQMNNNIIYFGTTSIGVGATAITIGSAVEFLYAPAVVIPGLSLYTLYNLPDIAYGYGGRINSLATSDIVKRTFYHEMAHAAHYQGLPSGSKAGYWFDNVARIIQNDFNNTNPPYGYPNTTGAEQCAIIEAWGFHIGSYMADLQYGTQNAFASGGSNEDIKQKRRFIYQHTGSSSGLEIFNPNNTADPDAWLADGLFLDLMDNRVHNGPPLNIRDAIDDYNGSTLVNINDNVEGISNASIYSAITSGAPTSMSTVKAGLQTSYPSKSTDIYNLFGHYGY
jgi:hypothetical protein